MTPANIRQELVKDSLRLFGEVRLRVVGGSMMPALWPDDIVTIRPRACDDIRPGEIVAFAPNGRIISHRVVKRTAATGWLVTRGDRCRQDDSPMSANEVLGVVTRVLRGHAEVPLRPAQTGRIDCAAWLLRHSDFATRIVVYAHRLWRTMGNRRAVCKWR